MRRGFSAGALFSGIGGFCYGFQDEGIKTSWAVENDVDATKVYRINFPNVRIVEQDGAPADIRKVSVAGDCLDPVDVLHAGFPCQSFSQAGERRGFEDPRGKLFYEVIRIIREFGDKKPSVLVLENAPHLRHGEGGSWFLEVAKEIKKAGYWFREQNCCEMDTYELTPLPQQRNRLFMVAFSMQRFRSGRFNFPSKRNVLPKDLSCYIDFNGMKDSCYYMHDENRYHNMISREADGKNCIYQLRKYRVRKKELGVCPTLTANMGGGGHNVPFVFDSNGLRKLTEWECLALQGFPDGFIFPEDVGKPKRYMQIGNSVAVPIARLLAKAIRDKLESESFEEHCNINDGAYCLDNF